MLDLSISWIFLLLCFFIQWNYQMPLLLVPVGENAWRDCWGWLTMLCLYPFTNHLFIPFWVEQWGGRIDLISSHIPCLMEEVVNTKKWTFVASFPSKRKIRSFIFAKHLSRKFLQYIPLFTAEDSNSSKTILI